MSALYTVVHHAHVATVCASVALFALRGQAVLRSQRWPMRPAVRHASMAVDTLLLCLGLALWRMLGVSLGDAPWLATKLGLLPLYVVLGSLALKRAHTQRTRALCYGLALATVGHMASVALTKQPLGWLSLTAFTGALGT